MPREILAAALEQIDAIVRPPGDLYFLELRAQTGKLRFLPAMLRSVSLGATLAGQATLDAVRHLRSTDGRGPAPSAPLGFVPSGWKRQVKAADGSVGSLGYRTPDTAIGCWPWPYGSSPASPLPVKPEPGYGRQRRRFAGSGDRDFILVVWLASAGRKFGTCHGANGGTLRQSGIAILD